LDLCIINWSAAIYNPTFSKTQLVILETKANEKGLVETKIKCQKCKTKVKGEVGIANSEIYPLT
jgi:hypothetical protein